MQDCISILDIMQIMEKIDAVTEKISHKNIKEGKETFEHYKKIT